MEQSQSSLQENKKTNLSMQTRKSKLHEITGGSSLKGKSFVSQLSQQYNEKRQKEIKTRKKTMSDQEIEDKRNLSYESGFSVH